MDTKEVVWLQFYCKNNALKKSFTAPFLWRQYYWAQKLLQFDEPNPCARPS